MFFLVKNQVTLHFSPKSWSLVSNQKFSSLKTNVFKSGLVGLFSNLPNSLLGVIK